MKKLLFLIIATLGLIVNAQANVITLVVPVAPGGATDIIARDLAQALTEAGNPTIVINKPGAERIIGANYAAEQPADGNTLFVGAISDTVLLPLYKPATSKINENTFIPVAMLGSTPAVLTASPDVSAKNYKELQALIQKNPEQYPIGSFGKLSSLLANSIFNSVKSRPTIIPYKSDPQLSVDIISGNVKLGIQTLPAAKEFIKAGKIKLITKMNEQFWFGIFAPAGTNPAVIKQLNQQINSAMSTREVREKLENMDYQRTSMTPEQFDTYYKQQLKFFQPLVTADQALEKQ